MPLRIGTPLPELTGATQWLNGEIHREDLIGSPILIHFWAVSCHICHDNMELVQKWRKDYADMGLQVVAVHMPRQEEDTDVAAVRAEIEALGITEPCAIDNLHTIGEAFENQLWPAYYLFDSEGNMKSRAGGYAGATVMDTALKRLFERIPALV